MSWLIYFGAGLAIAWLIEAEWWQRAVTVIAWPLVVTWGFSVEAIEWWRENGYHYEDSDAPH